MAEFAINGRFLAQPVTGVQRYGREIVAALDKLALERRYNIELLVPADVDPGLSLSSIRTIRVASGSGHRWEQTCLPRHGTPLLSLCNSAPLMARNRVVCLHDTNVYDVPGSYKIGFRAFYKTIHPLIARSAEVVTTVSHYSAAQLVRHLKIRRDRIVVIPNGHEHALRWQPESPTTCCTLRPYVLMVGSLAKHKNMARVLGLASALDAKGIDVKVVGVSGTTFADQRQTVADNVTFLGKVADDCLATLLKDALCLAFPSLNEGFGIPLLEAMAWNCPIIASRASSLPEVAGDAGLLADPTSDEEWLQHITQLHAQPALRDELRRRGRARLKAFSWRESARRYLELMTLGPLEPAIHGERQ